MALSGFSTHFPLLCPRSRHPNTPHTPHTPQEFRGFITIGGVDREVRLVAPHFPAAKGMRLTSDTYVSEVMTACRHQLEEALKTSSSALQYLLRFQEICSGVARDRVQAGQVRAELNEPLIRCLLVHLEALGWARVLQVSPDFTAFTLSTKDAGGREHELRVKVGADYPQEEPWVEAALPIDLELNYEPNAGVAGVVRVWESRLSLLQPFWDVMDEVDAAAVVLDPPQPGRHHTFRRLLLANHVNVQVTVSPGQPRSLPHCLLFGPAQLTRPMANRLSCTYEEWDTERSILDNLEHLLGVGVSRECGGGGGGEVEGVECPICYSLHYQDQLPDQHCENCFISFHTACLYDWLSSLPVARQAMNIITGECPSCGKNISCKVPA